MKAVELSSAVALDDYLESRQSGMNPTRPESLPQTDMGFLDDLLSLSAALQPDPDFLSHLGQRVQSGLLRSVSDHLATGAATELLLSRNAAVVGGARRHSSRSSWSLIGAAATLLVVAAALVLSLSHDRSAPAVIVLQRETLTPAKVWTPSVTASLPAATKPAPAIATATARREQPTAGSQESFLPLPQLPAIALLLGGGLGGAGGSGSPGLFAGAVELAASLPSGPDGVMVYAQRQPEELTEEGAQHLASRLGLEASLYTPWPLQAGQVLGDAVFVAALDDPMEIVFEGTSRFTLLNRNLTPPDAICWQAGQALPAESVARETAVSLLDRAALLQEPYEIITSGNVVRFYQLTDGEWIVQRPFASVQICSDGSVGSLSYQDFRLEPVGEYPIISAEQALNELASRKRSDRVWFQYRAPQVPWAESTNLSPRLWEREYQVGKNVHLFGPLRTLYPIDSKASLWVSLGRILLQGDLRSLVGAHRSYVESSGDTEAPMHVWGELWDADGIPTLDVQGWETAPETYWSGRIGRQDGERVLFTSDGQSYTLPDLSPDLEDGREVFVRGGVVADRLEWYAIQESVADSGVPDPGRSTPSGPVVVQQVELVYLIPSLEIVAQDPSADLLWNSAQPVWHFSGSAGGGPEFDAYVQAVPGTYGQSEG